ncbi:S1C family serine protease [Desulforamulus reducens]|nr:trypsin-like peptidase domain-containing protein [Desulforamulus reducens]
MAKNAEPAVVMVQATFEADVEVAYPYLDENKLDYTLNNIIQQVMQGLLPANESAMWQALADEMSAKPLEFLQKSGQKEVVQNGYRAVGSGFIITPDGYVITNAHVVAPDDELLKQQLSGPILENSVKNFMAEIGEGAAHIPADTREYVLKSITNMVIAYYMENIKVLHLNKTYNIGMGVQVPGAPLFQKGLKAEVIQAGGAVPKKDVALLKMEGQNNLPTVPLGDSNLLATGNKIFVMGYPGVATFHPLLSESSQAQPSLTEGIISAQKTMEGGWSVFQTNADMTHGNSGGPVFNEKGEVIGLATFGSVDMNTGQEIAGMNFIVPISVVKEFLDRGNVKATESLVTKTYREAMDLYYKEYYKKALKKFQEVAALCPGHAYVQTFIADSTKAISEGRDKSIPEWILFGVPAVLVIGIVIAVVVVRKKKASQVAGAKDNTTAAEAEAISKESEKEVEKPSSDVNN